MNTQHKTFFRLQTPIDYQTAFQTTKQSFLQNKSFHSNNGNSMIRTCYNKIMYAENIPNALQQKLINKNKLTPPFFIKNRIVKSRKQEIQNRNEMQILPHGFANILRAQSTVIKKKKQQQFYINREGINCKRAASSQQQKYQSNLFKPNLPKKISNQRKHSLNQQSQTKERQMDYLTLQNIKLNRPLTTIKSMTQNMKNDNTKENIYKRLVADLSLTTKNKNKEMHYRRMRKMRKSQRQEKQNLDFQLLPWSNFQHQEHIF